MSQTQPHSTAKPEQLKTDVFAVFRSIPGNANLHLIAHVEVPRYSQPNADGVELSAEKRRSLAVARAVEDNGTFIDDGNGYYLSDYSQIEGESFMVQSDLEEPPAHVEYEQNPAFDGVWNPETDE